MADKAYDIVKLYFKFRLGFVTIQFRKLYMHSIPRGFCKVFTVSTDAKEASLEAK